MWALSACSRPLGGWRHGKLTSMIGVIYKCKMTSEEGGTIGRKKEGKFVFLKLATGETPDYKAICRGKETKHRRATS